MCDDPLPVPSEDLRETREQRVQGRSEVASLTFGDDRLEPVHGEDPLREADVTLFGEHQLGLPETGLEPREPGQLGLGSFENRWWHLTAALGDVDLHA